jgi:hypothetical protein
MVRGMRYEVRGTGHGVRGMWYKIRGTWYRIHGTGHSRAQMNNKHNIFCTYGIQQAGWEPPCQRGGWWGL